MNVGSRNGPGNITRKRIRSKIAIAGIAAVVLVICAGAAVAGGLPRQQPSGTGPQLLTLPAATPSSRLTVNWSTGGPSGSILAVSATPCYKAGPSECLFNVSLWLTNVGNTTCYPGSAPTIESFNTYPVATTYFVNGVNPSLPFTGPACGPEGPEVFQFWIQINPSVGHIFAGISVNT